METESSLRQKKKKQTLSFILIIFIIISLRISLCLIFQKNFFSINISDLYFVIGLITLGIITFIRLDYLSDEYKNQVVKYEEKIGTEKLGFIDWVWIIGITFLTNALYLIIRLGIIFIFTVEQNFYKAQITDLIIGIISLNIIFIPAAFGKSKSGSNSNNDDGFGDDNIPKIY